MAQPCMVCALHRDAMQRRSRRRNACSDRPLGRPRSGPARSCATPRALHGLGFRRAPYATRTRCASRRARWMRVGVPAQPRQYVIANPDWASRARWRARRRNTIGVPAAIGQDGGPASVKQLREVVDVERLLRDWGRESGRGRESVAVCVAAIGTMPRRIVCSGVVHGLSPWPPATTDQLRLRTTCTQRAAPARSPAALKIRRES